MKEKLQKIRENAIAQIENSDGLAKLNDVRVAVLGKKGELTAVLKSIKEYERGCTGGSPEGGTVGK